MKSAITQVFSIDAFLQRPEPTIVVVTLSLVVDRVVGYGAWMFGQAAVGARRTERGRLDHLMVAQPEFSTHEVLAGYVERVTYHNVENSFCVLRARRVEFVNSRSGSR